MLSDVSSLRVFAPFRFYLLVIERYEKVQEEPQPAVWTAELVVVNGQNGIVAYFERSDDTAIRYLTTQRWQPTTTGKA